MSLTEATADRTPELRSLVERVAGMARKAGASEAEAYAERSRNASAVVRNGEIEKLSEAASKGVGLRVIRGGRLGFAATSDFSDDALRELVERALALAKAASPDEANVLPSGAALRMADRPRVERLFDESVAALDPGWKLRAAMEAERAARAEDPRCDNFEGSGAGEAVSEAAIASTRGLVDSERGTYVYVWCSPVVRDGTSLQTASWSDYRRHLAELDAPEAVGREAARRVVRMLGARKIPTCRVPVIFDPVMSAAFFGGLAPAFNGDLVFKRASFLAGQLGRPVASSLVTLSDEPRLPGGLASASFDGEGVPTRSVPLLEEGVLRSFLYDTRTARKAGTRSTGHAQRSWSSLPAIGPTNLVVRAGTTAPEEIVRSVSRGLYVTAMLGRGANTVTGDYSRGANGLWIEDGAFAHPVQEVTVAGPLLGMLSAIDAVGTDLTFRGSIGAPTVRFAELAVAGT